MTKEICGRLKLFYNIIELFSGQNYPTANTFFIKVCEIKETLYDWFICSNDVVKTMTSSMWNSIVSYNQDLTSYCIEYAIGKLHLQTFPFLMGLLTNMQHSHEFFQFLLQ